MTTYARPKGSVRFQELSAAKQPVPSAEIDNEFNKIVEYLNTYYPIPAGTAVIEMPVTAALADQDWTLPSNGEVLVYKTDVTAFKAKIYPNDPLTETVMRMPFLEMSGQDECYRLRKVGTNWLRIG